MTHRPPPGNPAFVAARHERGWHSQEKLAAAFEERAKALHLRLDVSIRQVRRWESARPPWPTPDYQAVLEALFGRPLARLGFTPPYGDDVFTDAGVYTDGDGKASNLIRGLHTDEQHGWWRTDPHHGADLDRFERLLAAERTAVAIREYAGGIVPGLLQTYEYTIAVLRGYAPALPEDELIRRATRRMERLAAIAPRMDGGRSLWFILDEAALHEPVGGEGVLREQLAHLLVASTRRNDVQIQILPSCTGAHPGKAGPFTLYDFSTRRVAYLEGLTGDSWSVRPSCLAAYSLAYDHLQAAAWSVEVSMEAIAQRVAEMEMTWGNPIGG